MAKRSRREKERESRDRQRTPEEVADEQILDDAREDFKRADNWESDFRDLFIDDTKFCLADSDNGWQWPADLKKDRDINKRPALTINKTAKHVDLVVNDMRKNKPSITVKPVGEDVSYKAAQIWEGLFRHIEYDSSAQTIYDDAATTQVEGGIGYVRVITEYTPPDFDKPETFNRQKIKIAPVKDALGVYMDPDIKQKDGSDARFGFVFESMPRTQFEKEYPDVELPSGSTGVEESIDWVTNDDVRVAEYYRLVDKKDELIYLEDDGGQAAMFKRSDVPAQFKSLLTRAERDKSHRFQSRDFVTRQLEWYKIAGCEIVDRRLLPGQYIPIGRLPGKERIVEGKLVRKGLVRDLKDAQRMYNYNTSGQVEYGALATKTPWIVPVEAFDGNEQAWEDSNKKNAAYLTYRSWDEEGNQIPPPQRPQPPGESPAFITGMQIADRELMMASGQYQSEQGQPGNEKSGKAINARQHQSETANFHFADMQAMMIAHLGRIILDLAPHIYDTEQVLKIQAKDYSISEIHVQPEQDEAMLEQKDKKGDEEITRVFFNLKKGRYLVQADMGPAYATQRQEAWNAFIQIVTQSPELISEIGDLMFMSADFPLADKIAERIKRKIKQTAPWLLDDGAAGPLVQQLQGEVQQLSGQLSQALEKLSHMGMKLKGREEQRDVNVYKAITERLGAEGKTIMELAKLGSTDQLVQLLTQTIGQAMGIDLQPVIDANEPDLAAEAGGGQPSSQIAGAQQ